MIIDISQAIKVRNMQRDSNKFHVGIINKDIEYSYKKGQVCLFRYEKDSKTTCTIEFPISDEWIAKNRAENNYLTTIGTCIGFPLNYIDEILI